MTSNLRTPNPLTASIKALVVQGLYFSSCSEWQNHDAGLTVKSNRVTKAECHAQLISADWDGALLLDALGDGPPSA